MLRFSHNVDLRNLGKHLKITSDKKSITFNLTSRNNTVYANTQIPEFGRTPVKVTVESGLAGSSNAYMIKSKTHTLTVPKPRLRFSNYGMYYRDGKRYHRMYMREGFFDLTDLKKHLKIEPSVENLQVLREGTRGLQLAADWEPDKNYDVIITKGLLINDWYTLEEDMKFQIHSGKIRAEINFQDPEKFYFARGGQPHVTIDSTALKSANISISRMFPSNVVRALEHINRNNKNTPSYAFIALCAEPLSNKKIDLNYHAYKTTSTQLTLDNILPEDQRGLFCLSASASQAGTRNKLVMVTDLGSMAHWDDKSLHMFVHNLWTLKPVKSASVTVYSDKQQKLATAFTNAEGLVTFEGFPTSLGRPKVAVIEKGNDYTFLELQERYGTHRIDNSQNEFNPSKYDGFIYTDRDLYRPGDTVHLRFIGRTNIGIDPLADIPLQIVINQPNGKEIQSSTVKLSEFGTASFDLETSKDFATGKYGVFLKIPGQKSSIAAGQFQIETYVPARMRATTEIKDKIWKTEKEYEIRVKAEQLHGGPAPDRKVDCVLLFEKISRIDGFEDYNFGNESGTVPTPLNLGETKTNDDGVTTFPAQVQQQPGVSTPLKVLAVTQAYELGGRRVSSSDQAMYLNDDLLLGMKLQKGDEESNFVADIVAVNADDMSSATTQTVEVTLEQMTWRYYMRRYYGYYGSSWEHDYEVIEKHQVQLKDGKAKVPFGQISYGGYRLRVSSNDTKMFCEQTFRKNWRAKALELVEQRSKDVVRTSLDKSTYEPGEKARLTIMSPFDGRAVVVLQGNDIKRMFTAELTDGKCEVQIPVTENDQPNIWAEVTVVHTPTKDAFDGFPYAAFNVQDIRVRPAEARLSVSVGDLPEKIEPQTKLKIQLTTKNGLDKAVPAECTVALVDEGIHLLSNYKKPDPAAYIFRSRKPHKLQRAHYYDLVNYDFSAPATGGDSPSGQRGMDPNEIKKRLGAERDNWIKSVALWSGVVTTDENGEAEIEVDVPEFTGQLRVVAVAVSKKSAASTEDRVYVKRPYMLRTSMPRYLLTGDEAKCRATVFNTTDADCEAKISWEADGEYIKGEGSRKVDIKAGSEASVLAKVKAQDLPASGHIQWKVEIESDNGKAMKILEEKAALPVNGPAHLFQSDHQLVLVNPGETRVFENDVFHDDERTEIEISVSVNPILQLEEALRHVVGYPYGCVEQTTSRCFPLFALRQAKEFIGTSIADKEELDDMLQMGIDRLFTMQTRHGGLAFWPGRANPYEYGTVYGGHFLTAIHRSREYRMDENNYQTLQNYLRELAGDSRHDGHSGLFMRAYATYVLALGGDKAAPQLIESFDNLKDMPKSGRYLLAAAIALTTRDMEKVEACMQKAPAIEWPGSEASGTLHSELREMSLHLMALRAAKAPQERCQQEDSDPPL